MSLRILGWSCSLVDISYQSLCDLLGLNKEGELFSVEEKENSQILFLVVPSKIETPLHFKNLKKSIQTHKKNFNFFGKRKKKNFYYFFF